MHPSLLPKYRGAAPIQKALMNGDMETGVSIIKVDPNKFDAGDIVKQQVVQISPKDTFKSLADSLISVGSEKLLESIRDIRDGKLLSVPQDPKNVSMARKIQDSDRKISWSLLDAREVWNRWRALSENGGIFCMFRGKRLKLLKLQDPNGLRDSEMLEPGSLRVVDGRLLIRCKTGSFIECTQLQIEGKNPVEATSFIHGYCQNDVSFE